MSDADRFWKPCPFCGSSDQFGFRDIEGKWFVECHGCFATGPEAATLEAAFDAWEQRSRQPRCPLEPIVVHYANKRSWSFDDAITRLAAIRIAIYLLRHNGGWVRIYGWPWPNHKNLVWQRNSFHGYHGGER